MYSSWLPNAENTKENVFVWQINSNLFLFYLGPNTKQFCIFGYKSRIILRIAVFYFMQIRWRVSCVTKRRKRNRYSFLGSQQLARIILTAKIKVVFRFGADVSEKLRNFSVELIDDISFVGWGTFIINNSRKIDYCQFLLTLT